MIKHILVAGAALILSTPAAAKDVWIGDWFIHGDEGGCVMRIRLGGGTGFTFGAGSPSAAMLTLENPAWRSIKPGMPYPVTVIFDGKIVSLDAAGNLAGSREVPAVSVTLTGNSLTEFSRLLIGSHVVSFMRGGIVLDRLSLQGSAAAFATWSACVRGSDAGDPFAQEG